MVQSCYCCCNYDFVVHCNVFIYRFSDYIITSCAHLLCVRSVWAWADRYGLAMNSGDDNGMKVLWSRNNMMSILNGISLDFIDGNERNFALNGTALFLLLKPVHESSWNSRLLLKIVCSSVFIRCCLANGFYSFLIHALIRILFQRRNHFFTADKIAIKRFENEVNLLLNKRELEAN